MAGQAQDTLAGPWDNDPVATPPAATASSQGAAPAPDLSGPWDNDPVAPTHTSFMQSAKAGAGDAVRDLAASANAVSGKQVADPDSNIDAAQPVDYHHGLDLGSFADKQAYQIAKSFPVIGAGIAGAGIGAAGAAPAAAAAGAITSETGGWGAIPSEAGGALVGGALGAGTMSAAQTLGPAYARELKATPNDPDGAMDRALKTSRDEGVIGGATWAAFGFAPFKNAVKDTLLQAFAVQPGATAATRAGLNVAEGKDATAGMSPDDYLNSVTGTIIPAAGHAAIHAAGIGAGNAAQSAADTVNSNRTDAPFAGSAARAEPTFDQPATDPHAGTYNVEFNPETRTFDVTTPNNPDFRQQWTNADQAEASASSLNTVRAQPQQGQPDAAPGQVPLDAIANGRGNNPALTGPDSQNNPALPAPNGVIAAGPDTMVADTNGNVRPTATGTPTTEAQLWAQSPEGQAALQVGQQAYDQTMGNTPDVRAAAAQMGRPSPQPPQPPRLGLPSPETAGYVVGPDGRVVRPQTDADVWQGIQQNQQQRAYNESIGLTPDVQAEIARRAAAVPTPDGATAAQGLEAIGSGAPSPGNALDTLKAAAAEISAPTPALSGSEAPSSTPEAPSTPPTQATNPLTGTSDQPAPPMTAGGSRSDNQAMFEEALKAAGVKDYQRTQPNPSFDPDYKFFDGGDGKTIAATAHVGNSPNPAANYDHAIGISPTEFDNGSLSHTDIGAAVRDIADKVGIPPERVERGLAKFVKKIRDISSFPRDTDDESVNDYGHATDTPEMREQFGDDSHVPARINPSLEPTKPEERAALPPKGKVGQVQYMRPEDIKADPKTFQFRSNEDARGIDDRLRGQEWDNNLADPLLVYKDENGQHWVADGHHRLALAHDLQSVGRGPESIPVQVLDSAAGNTPAHARYVAAYKNIASGRATLIDAAKVVRDAKEAGMDNLPKLPGNEGFVKQTMALSSLSPKAFDLAVQRVTEPEYAAMVPTYFSDPKEQFEAIKQLAELDPSNQNQARSMLADIRAAGMVSHTQDSLFGPEQMSQSLLKPRSRIMENATKVVRRTSRTFGNAAEGHDTLAAAGNKLDKDANQAGKSKNDLLLAHIEANAHRKGEISDALNRAATDLHNGASIAKATSRFLSEAREDLRSGSSGRDEGGDDPGREGDAPEEVGPGFSFRRDGAGNIPGNIPDNAIRLTDGIYAVPTDTYTEHEAQIARAVNAAIQKMVPGTRVRDFRSIHADGQQVSGFFARPLNRPELMGLIHWSMSRGANDPTQMQTARHEVIHALRQQGFFTPDEWSTLAKAAENGGWLAKHNIPDRYGDLTHDAQVEEAVAEEFASRGVAAAPAAGRPLLARLRTALQRVAASVRSIVGPATDADTLFRNIESGEIGRRGPNMAEGATQKGVLKQQRPTLDLTDQGEQHVLPGAERLSQGEMDKRAMDARAGQEKMQPKKPQQGMLDGLFAEPDRQGALFQRRGRGLDEEKQSDLLQGTDKIADPDFEKEQQAALQPSASLAQKARAFMDDTYRHFLLNTNPMAAGSDRSMVMAKDWANKSRLVEYQAAREVKALTKEYKPADLAAMWNAMDATSQHAQDLMANGVEYDDAVKQTSAAGVGIFALPADQKHVALDLVKRSQRAWNEALAAGEVQGAGIPFWAPRQVSVMGADGIARAPKGRTGPEQADSIGRGITTGAGSLKERKYQTVAETDAAAQAAFGPGAGVVRDIRTIPLALSRFEKAIATRELINSIREIGQQTGKEMARQGGDDTGNRSAGFFTLNHPAFKTWTSRYDKAGNPVRDENGAPIIDSTPMWISNEWRGPLSAIIRSRPNDLVRNLMAIKAKSMSLVLYSPLAHGMTIWGKALPAMFKMNQPVKSIRRAVGGIMMDGNKARNDVPTIRRAILAGLNPVSSLGHLQDISGMLNAQTLNPEDPNLERTMSGAAMGKLVGMVSPKAGQAVQRGIDRGWHFKDQTLLWDRIADMQWGIFTTQEQTFLNKGKDPKTAARMAAEFANQYAGSIPAEAMSNGAQIAANALLFSRQFTLSNLQTFKTIIKGNSAPVRAQIRRDAGDTAAKVADNTARKKAAMMIAMDIFFGTMANSLGQNATNIMMRGHSVGQEASGYAQRLHDAIGEVQKGNMVNPLTALSATRDNEHFGDSDKRYRILYETDPKTNTNSYIRLPVGKVGEDYQGWISDPLTTFERKQNPLFGATIDVLTNHDSFDRPIMTHDIGTLAGRAGNAAQALEHVGGKLIPLDAIQAAVQLAAGQDKRTPAQAKMDREKLEFSAAGMSLQSGYPGGPEAGLISTVKKANDNKISSAMPDIRTKVQTGDVAGARKVMNDLGMQVGFQNALIRKFTNPASAVTGKAMGKFNREATPEQQEEMRDYRKGNN